MKKLFSMIWLQIKLRIGLPAFQSMLHARKGIQKLVGFVLLGLILLVTLMGSYLFLLSYLMETAVMLGFAETLFTMLYMFGMILVLFFGILYCVSMYFAKDNEFLATLPVPRRYVFISKFVPAMLGEILTFVLIALPPAIVYGIQVQADVLFYLRMLIPALFMPMLPFVIANILAALLMSASVIVRHKDKIIMVGSLLFMVAVIVGQQYLNMAMQNITSDGITSLLTGEFAQALGRYFPPALWGAQFLVSADWASAGLLLLVSAAALALCVLIAGRLFLKGALSQSEALKKYKKVDVAQAAQKTSSQTSAIFRREWKTMLRSPVYALNGLTSVLLGPLMLVILFLLPTSDSGINPGELTSADSTLFVAIAAIYTYFICSINVAGATAYSREGGAVWIMKTMPISAKRIARAKLLFSLSIPLCSIVTTCIALAFVFPLSVLEVVIVATFAVCAIFPVATFGLLLDLVYPRLKWESEQKAIKQNAISVVSMLAGFVYAVGLGFLGYKLLDAHWDVYPVLAVLCGISICIGCILTALLTSKAEPLQAKME